MDCGLFCATPAYCKTLTETVLANFIKAITSLVETIGGNLMAIFDLVNKVMQLAE